jgi:hypothetical protein
MEGLRDRELGRCLQEQRQMEPTTYLEEQPPTAASSRPMKQNRERRDIILRERAYWL